MGMDRPRAASPVITDRGGRPQGMTPSVMASEVMASQTSTVPGLSLDVLQTTAAPQWLREIQAPGCSMIREVAGDLGVHQLPAPILKMR